MMTYLTLFLLMFLVAAGMSVLRRLRERIRLDPPVLDDDDVRRIEAQGSLYVELDEPLDPEQIRQAEERFWREDWEDPEEYLDP